tara:strand:- start:1345 stop:1542 length:198 start_codon:yes stop_codon:yes gene_type:complete
MIISTTLSNSILTGIIIAIISLLGAAVWSLVLLTTFLKERRIIKRLERMRRMGKFVWDETEEEKK